MRYLLRSTQAISGMIGLALLLVSPASLAVTSFYVSPTGDDNAAGTSAAPWKTLTKARNHLRGISNFNDDVHIVLKNGTYELPATFTLTSQDSGRNGYTITYRAENPGGATISGGTLITDWTDNNADGIWEATVPAGSDSRQLYVNGTRATRARSADGSGWVRNSTGYSTPSGVSSWSNQDDIELVFNYRWKHNRLRVASVSGNQATLTPESWAGVQMGPFGIADQEANGSTVKWVENNLALLDDPGEWYLDTSIDRLYYKPRGGEDLVNGNGAVNLALNGTATQVNTWNGYGADRAIDGNTGGNWGAGEVTHTDVGVSQPYWTLDLGSVQDIDTIRLWNRTDCCSNRLTDFHVFVSDTPFTGTTVLASQNQSGVFDYHNIGTAGTTTDVTVNRTGRYVRVQLSSTATDIVLSLAEVQVFGQVSNVATNGTATQSSTWSGYGADRAIDGDTNGSWPAGSVTHTNDSESEKWWEVDLGQSYTISEIRIWNRTDCCSNRLSNYHVFVKDSPFVASTISGLQSESGVTHYPQTTQPNPTATINTSSLAGRYVRIQKNDADALSLAEVEVFAAGGGGGGGTPVVLPRLEKLIDANGVSDVRFEGLTFSYATWLQPNEPVGYLSVQAGVWQVDSDSANIEAAFEHTKATPAAVHLKFANNVVFSGNTFKNLGATALAFDRGSQVSTAFNNTFDRISSAAIVISNPQDHHLLDPSHRVKDILVDNNLLQNIAEEYTDSPAITSFWTDRAVIINNTIDTTAYSGISIGWGWGRYDVEPWDFLNDNSLKGYNHATTLKDNLVLNNYVIRAMWVNHDGGCVYNLGANMNSRVTGNVCTASPDLNGAVYLDNGSRGFQVNENVTYNNVGPRVNFHIKGAEFHTVTNNDLSGGSSTFNPAFQGVVDAAGQKSSITERSVADIVNGLPPALQLPAGAIPPAFGAVVGKTATASTNSSGANNAIDANAGTFWDAGSATSGWLQVDMGGQITLQEVAVAFGKVVNGEIDAIRTGVTFQIQISNDGSNWTNQTFSTADGFGGSKVDPTTSVTTVQDIYQVFISGTPSVRYVRINVSNSNEPLGILRLKLKGPVSPAGTNLALNGSATQVNTWNGNVASRAIDGNTGGNWSAGEVTHTDVGVSQPYWTLDLGSVNTINTIRLWNRTDCCSDRLTDYHVFVSDTPFIGTTVAASQNQAGVSDYHNTGTAGTTTDVTVNRSGRYVRVQLSSTATDIVLSLAEVQVFGESGGGSSSNVATNGTATQSSTWNGYDAGRAIDGNTGGNWGAGEVTHTDFVEPEKWWEVDLGQSHTISEIKVWNRTDCCADRLSDYYVFVKDSPFSASTISGLQSESGVTSYHQTSQPNPSATISTGSVAGRYVRIQKNDATALSLAEVEVIAN